MKLEEKKLPNGWEVKKLGEVCIYSKGKMPKVLMEEKNEKCSRSESATKYKSSHPPQDEEASLLGRKTV